jgi:hypothetical protein
MDSANNNAVLIECCSCPTRLGSVLLARHYEDEHGSKIYVCPRCPGKGVFFYQPGKAKSHCKNKHKEQEEWCLKRIQLQVSARQRESIRD